ncbi:MAG: DUF4112 domain-containing protein [Prevotella sp.]|nr:DUF4112 domain-containing protein [Prevotella sp.]
MENSRRSSAQKELGLTTYKEERKQQQALQKELERQQAKAERRRMLEEDTDYRMIKGVKTVMDDYYLDPILGFFLPAVGDILTSLCVLPFLWVALARVKSIPLTLACLYNTMIDLALGLIPFYIGDIVDAFNKSYKKNYRLIVGFVEDDRNVIREVNGKAVKTAIMIGIFCIIIYYLVKWTYALGSYLYDLVLSLFS